MSVGGIRVWFRETAGHGILQRVKLTEALFWGVNLGSPSTEPILKGVEVLLEVEG